MKIMLYGISSSFNGYFKAIVTVYIFMKGSHGVQRMLLYTNLQTSRKHPYTSTLSYSPPYRLVTRPLRPHYVLKLANIMRAPLSNQDTMNSLSICWDKSLELEKRNKSDQVPLYLCLQSFSVVIS